VLSAGPWAYWRFEALNNGMVADEVVGGPSLRATGPVKVIGTPDHNRCLEFGAEYKEQCVAMDGLWEPPGDPGYAVELWALPARIGHAALASLIAPGPPKEEYKHLFLVELTANDRQSLLAPGLFRFLHRWPPGDSGGDNLFSMRHYVPNRWHHLVAQRSGSQLELYVDGVPTQPVTPQSASVSEPCQLLLGRLKPIPRPIGRVHSRPFVGLVDELALYNRPLSAEEIRHHFALGSHLRAVNGAPNPAAPPAPASTGVQSSTHGWTIPFLPFLQRPGHASSRMEERHATARLDSANDRPPSDSILA
jgi:hypothetical protein